MKLSNQTMPDLYPRPTATPHDMVMWTKFYVPPLQRQFVRRPRLVEELNRFAASDRKLTLLSTPAGFGKTSLLAEWVAQAGIPVAWLSCDAEDNDLSRFLLHLGTAISENVNSAGLGSATLSVLTNLYPPPVTLFLSSLVNDVALNGSPFVLVLDDYHHITSDAIHEALDFLLRYQPPQMHVIIATRQDPPLPLARERARGWLAELRSTELRFTQAETGEFLNGTMGLNLSAGDVRMLDKRTEGWIVGLQLVALSLDGHAAPHTFIKDFTGSHRYVLDYLLDEVLARQTDEVQAFLLATCVLDRLSGDLCDALIGGVDGQAMLQQLERANLFIVPLDGKRRWYRYHALFADALRTELATLHPERVKALHGLASAWYAGHGSPAEAVNHALQAGDVTLAADLLEEHAMTELAGWGEVRRLGNWLDALPETIIRQRPRLALFRAVLSLQNNELEQAESYLQAAESAIVVPVGELPVELRNILGQITLQRAMMARYLRRFTDAIDLALQAHELLSEDNLTLRAVCLQNVGETALLGGDLLQARNAYTEAIEISRAAHDGHLELMSYAALAWLASRAGNLREAETRYREALTRAGELSGADGRPQPVVGLLKIGLGEVIYERNDLHMAGALLKEGLAIGTQTGQPEALRYGYLALAWFYHTQGRPQEAQAMMQSVAQLEPARVTGSRVTWAAVRVAARQVRLWLAQGNLAAASGWARERALPLKDSFYFAEEFEYLALARVRLAEGDHDAGLALLDHLLATARHERRIASVIKLLLVRALTLWQTGRGDEGLLNLGQAVALAEPEGYVRTFLDEGQLIADMLHALRAAPGGPDHTYPDYYVGHLLVAFAGKPAEPHAAKRLQPLVEPLSDRELEVLRLVAEGRSNSQVAAQLYVSVNTVKKHLTNIFSKLETPNRTAAVARARDLNLL